MALSKNYKSGDMYNYAVIEHLYYIKNQNINLSVSIYEKFIEDINLEIINKEVFDNLSEESKKRRYVRPDGMYEILMPKKTSMLNFVIPLNTPEWYESDKNVNLFKYCYEWLRKNIDIFNTNDWEDC